MYLVVAAVLCVTTVSSAPSHHHNIHKRMTTSEVRRVFGTAHADVPEYKLVNIKTSRIQKRDATYQRVLEIDDDHANVKLVLSPTDGYLVSEDTPVTWVTRTSNGFEFRDDPNIMKEIGELLEDPKTASSFVISRKRNRRFAVDGYIGSKNLVIRSLPEKLFDSLSVNGSNHHVMFETKLPLADPLRRSARETNSPPNNRSTVENQTLPDIVYPEILVVLDSTVYASHGWDVFSLIPYYLILWNSVDLRYKSLKDPQCRINIARFVISTSVEGTPYIEDSILGGYEINSWNALEGAMTFWYNTSSIIPFSSYDAVMTFTNYALLVVDWEKDPPYPRLTGQANIGGICDVDPVAEKLNAVAIIEDAGDLDSLTTAHELGHLLGLPHDSPDEGVTCTENDNYVMAGDFVTDPTQEARLNYWSFSECSIQEFREDLATYDRSCIYNKPATARKILPKILSHKFLGLRDPCHKFFHVDSYSCKYGSIPKEDECTVLYCQHPWGMCMKTHGIPPDGTPCDDGNKYCEKGKCISP